MFRKYIQCALAVIITLGIYFFLFSKVPFPDVVSALKTANISYVILALVISVISKILISAYRWKTILVDLNCDITFKESLLIKMGSNSLISIFPLRVGEFSRLLYLNRLKEVPYSKSLVSILAEYLFNFLTLLLFALMGLIAYFIQNENIASISNIKLSFLSILPLCLLSLGSNGKSHDKPKKHWPTLFKNYFHELTGLLKNKTIILCTITFTFATIFNFYLLSRALNISIPLYAILLFTPLVILIGAIPITIAGIGARELATLFLFTKFASADLLLSLGIAYVFVQFLFPLIVGTFLTGVFINRIVKTKNTKQGSIA